MNIYKLFFHRSLLGGEGKTERRFWANATLQINELLKNITTASIQILEPLLTEKKGVVCYDFFAKKS